MASLDEKIKYKIYLAINDSEHLHLEAAL